MSSPESITSAAAEPGDPDSATGSPDGAEPSGAPLGAEREKNSLRQNNRRGLMAETVYLMNVCALLVQGNQSNRSVSAVPLEYPCLKSTLFVLVSNHMFTDAINWRNKPPEAPFF